MKKELIIHLAVWSNITEGRMVAASEEGTNNPPRCRE